MRSRVQTLLKSWIFQVSVRTCSNCVHNCEGHSFTYFISAVQGVIYFIYHLVHWFIYHGNIWTHKWPAANISGFIAQLVRASHEALWGHRFKPCLCTCYNCIHNSKDRSFTWFHIRSSMYYSFHIKYHFIHWIQQCWMMLNQPVESIWLGLFM